MKLLAKIRNRHLFLLDLVAMVVIPALALALLGEEMSLRLGAAYRATALIVYTVVSLCVKLGIYASTGLYRRYWLYASVGDVTQVLGTMSLATLAVLALFVTTDRAGIDLALPWTLPLLDGVLSGLASSVFRLSLRTLAHWRRTIRRHVHGRRVLVVGAGEAGIMVMRELYASAHLEMEPVAFVDDDPVKIGTSVQGLPVLGRCAEIPALVARHHIQQIIVAIPSAPLPRQNELVALCERTGVATYNLPGIYQLLAGYKTLSCIPQVDVNRLLHRDVVETDRKAVVAILKGATVLVTGAGGSIGSELCRQIARHNPAKIVLLGHGENSIFEIDLGLRLSYLV